MITAADIHPAGGFSSITFAHEAAQFIEEEVEDGRPAQVFYIGNPAGVLIDRSIEAELRGHLPKTVELRFHRLAITPEQIADYDLPTKPRKESDRRALHVTRTVEAEAMPAGVLRWILRAEIEALLPRGALAVAEAAEEAEREHLTRWADLIAEVRP